MIFQSNNLLNEVKEIVESNSADVQKLHSEIDRIKQAKSDLMQSIESKGVPVPESAKINDLPSYVASINTESKHFYTLKTLSTSEWIEGENAVYTLSFTDPLIKADYKLEIAFDTQDLLQLMNDGVSNIRADNDNGTVNVICIGAKPTAELTAQISFVKLVQA